MLLRGHRGVVMERIREAAAHKSKPPEVDQKLQEERQRIAEHLVRALEKAGYSLEGSHLEDNGVARTLRRDN